MPYKSEKLKIEGTKHDRRIKLTPEQRDEIKAKWASGLISQKALARLYKVSARLISFVLFPERHERNKELRQERGGTKIYYNREKQTKAIREHRRHKQNLYLKGELNNENN